MLQRLYEKLDPLQRGYLLGLCVPATILLVVLKLVRLFGAEAAPGVLATVDLLKSEVFLAAGLTLAGLWLLRVAASSALRRVNLALLQLLWLVVLTIEVSGHQFFVTTGSSLDYFLLTFSLENFADNAEVIGSEAPTWLFVLAPLAVGWTLGAPWLMARRLSTNAPKEERRPARAGLGTLAAALVFLGAATLPPFVATDQGHAQATSMNVALSASAALRESLQPPVEASSTALQTRLAPADASDTQQRRRNVAFIILESTRAQSTSMYNPELETTPFLEELAEESTLAERAYAVVPHTSKALVSLLCGISPRLNMPITEAVPGNIPANCLAELLGEVGYDTAYFQSAYEYFEKREQLVDNMGYDTFVPVDDMDTEDFDKVNYFGREDDIMLEPSREWLEGRRDRPFFATYLTLTPHHNYTNPRRYGSHEFVEGDDTLNRYLNTIHYVDNFAENLINQYKEMGLYEDTIFVFVGDHGEAFGEHGRHQHDNVIYEEGLHIPLLIHDPRRPERQRIELPVNQLDLSPTLVSMLGYQITGGEYPGANIFELDQVRPLYAHCWYERRCMAEILGDEKYIHHFGNPADEFFDLAEDPLEKTNIAGDQSDLDERRERLTNWRSRVNAIYRNHAEQALGRYLFDEVPDIEHPLEAKFDDRVDLLGYNLSDDVVRPGQTFTITYYFRANDRIAEGWKLFVHGEGSGPFQNLDHEPVSGLYPMQKWQPGQIVADEHTIRVPDNWKPGRFDIHLGIWHDDEGRMPIEDAAAEENRLEIASVEVVPEEDASGAD